MQGYDSNLIRAFVFVNTPFLFLLCFNTKIKLTFSFKQKVNMFSILQLLWWDIHVITPKHICHFVLDFLTLNVGLVQRQCVKGDIWASRCPNPCQRVPIGRSNHQHNGAMGRRVPGEQRHSHSGGGRRHFEWHLPEGEMPSFICGTHYWGWQSKSLNPFVLSSDTFH